MKGWTRSTPAVKRAKLKPKRKASHLETKFVRLWKACGGPPLEPEFCFHPTRRWRFDFSVIGTWAAIEIEGGRWTSGRHSRGAGMANDCEKYLEAIFLGYTVIRLVDSQIKAPVIERLIAFVGEKK